MKEIGTKKEGKVGNQNDCYPKDSTTVIDAEWFEVVADYLRYLKNSREATK